MNVLSWIISVAGAVLGLILIVGIGFVLFLIGSAFGTVVIGAIAVALVASAIHEWLTTKR